MEPVVGWLFGWAGAAFIWATLVFVNEHKHKRKIRDQAEEISKLKAQIAYYRRELLRNARSKREADMVTSGSVIVGHPALLERPKPDPTHDTHAAFDADLCAKIGHLHEATDPRYCARCKEPNDEQRT